MKVLVIETFFGKRPQNFYYLMLTDVSSTRPRHKGFYRERVSFNAFFNSTRSPKANVTELRQFTCDVDSEIVIRKQFLKDVDWDNLQTFDTIWDFYSFIGYDYKTRRYKSGERQKRWNGQYFE